jgi:hypothetical protein
VQLLVHVGVKVTNGACSRGIDSLEGLAPMGTAAVPASHSVLLSGSKQVQHPHQGDQGAQQLL